MESSKKVQRIAKIFKILSKIGFVCSIIGLVSCVISSICFGVWGNDENLIALLTEYGVTFDYNTILSLCICSAVECAFSIFLYYYASKFYDNVCKNQECFDKNRVKEIRKLGILHIVLPIASAMIIAIIMECFKVDLAFTNDAMLTLGIVYLIMSFVLDYGADIRKENEIRKSELESAEKIETTTTTEPKE